MNSEPGYAGQSRVVPRRLPHYQDADEPRTGVDRVLIRSWALAESFVR